MVNPNLPRCITTSILKKVAHSRSRSVAQIVLDCDVLTSGLEAVKAGLNSPAQPLPIGFRQRATELKMREQLAEPASLAHSVRDVVAMSRGHALSAGEKTWLDKSCQRLSTEAALVDHISIFEAQASIWAVVRELGVH